MLIFFCRDSFLKFSKRFSEKKTKNRRTKKNILKRIFLKNVFQYIVYILPGVSQDASINKVIDNISKTRQESYKYRQGFTYKHKSVVL